MHPFDHLIVDSIVTSIGVADEEADRIRRFLETVCTSRGKRFLVLGRTLEVVSHEFGLPTSSSTFRFSACKGARRELYFAAERSRVTRFTSATGSDTLSGLRERV